MTLSCTCSSLLISEAVLEHADVFADRMRFPEAGINLVKFNKRCLQGSQKFCLFLEETRWHGLFCTSLYLSFQPMIRLVSFLTVYRYMNKSSGGNI